MRFVYVSDFFRKCTQNRLSGRKRFVMKKVSLMHKSSISGTYCCCIVLNIIMLEKCRRRFSVVTRSEHFRLPRCFEC